MSSMRKIDFISNLTTSESQLIEAFKVNDEVVLKLLYISNFSKIEILVLKNNGTKEHAKDIYQDAFLDVWRNIKDNKFIPKNESSINGYLYTIAKNKWMDYLRSKEYKKTITTSKETHFDKSESLLEKIKDDKFHEERLQKAMQAFTKLGLPCKSLLMKFYFEKKSMKTIAGELQLDAASTRNKKYRCMQKLRELALKID